MEVSMAEESDIPSLCALLHHLFLQEAEFTPDFAVQSRGLSRIIGNPEVGCIWVVRLHGQIVGMVNLLFTISTALGAPVVLLEDMVVLPEMRGQGIGTTLLETAIQHAKQKGFQRMTLLTDHDNHRSQSFYRKHGFTQSAMTPFRLALA